MGTPGAWRMRDDLVLLNVDELSERLNVSPGWIYERTRTKSIPHRKIGKYVRFVESEVNAWLDETYEGPGEWQKNATG